MLAAVWLSVLAAAVGNAQTEVRMFGKLGGDVVLATKTGPQPIIIITWKHGEDLAIEWERNETDKYRQFEERGHLNTTNAEMTITGLTQADGGLYTLHINNVQAAAIHLSVISAVPKPSISVSCDDTKSHCKLTCDGDTTGAEPCSYIWRSDDSVITSASLKELRVRKESSEVAKEFSCELQNPVSSERSQALANPFLAPGGPKVAAGLVVFVILLVAVVLLVVVHRLKTGMWFFRKDSMPWESDFWRKDETGHAVESNGTSSAQPQAHREEETQMM